MLLRRRAGLLAIALAVLGLVVFTVSSATSLSRRIREQPQPPVLARFPEESDRGPQADVQVPISEPEENEIEVEEEFDDDEQASDEDGEADEDEIANFDADDEQAGGSSIQHREIYSVSTRDRKYLKIIFFGEDAYNANVIPHPTMHDQWIVVAQRRESSAGPGTAEEVTCTAFFFDDAFVCNAAPTVLPIAESIHPGNCKGKFEYFNDHSGPKDARVFYGPDGPLAIYGSQSLHTCFGIWIHDARMLLEPFSIESATLNSMYTTATELQRPPPYGELEKNFFLFWDLGGRVYAHHNIYPERVFAQVDIDGSVGPNLAPETAFHDQQCMSKYMPYLGPELESIHQATNSISITLCRRKDKKCRPTPENTLAMIIFQHKTYFSYHAVYEPYVMLIRQTAPFSIHSISQRPLWISGRNDLTAESNAAQYRGVPESDIPEGHTEMFYVTSLSWRGHAQRYHGYLDDVMFLAFGIEDTASGLIDVKAEDLLQDMARC